MPTPDPERGDDQAANLSYVNQAIGALYTSAIPFACVRADGTENRALTTLREAIDWTSAGGAGSITYVNRPTTLIGTAPVVMAPGTILDLQHNPVSLAGTVIRLGREAVIRNNALLFSGRIAPDYPDGPPDFKFYLIGGTFAGRINYLVNTTATCVLDGVGVTDFGQAEQFGGLNVGMATSDEVGPKVILRNGAYFSLGHPPHANTLVTTEAPLAAASQAALNQEITARQQGIPRSMGG